MFKFIWGVMVGAAGAVWLLSAAQAADFPTTETTTTTVPDDLLVPPGGALDEVLTQTPDGPAWRAATGGGPAVDGKSAYQIWLDEGNAGTVIDFLASLRGQPGVSPAQPNFSVTTLPPGSAATLTGNYPDLLLGLPRGDPGVPGTGGGGASMGPRTVMSCPGVLAPMVSYIQHVKMVAPDGTDCITVNSPGQVVLLLNVEIEGGKRSVRVVRGGSHVIGGEYHDFTQNGIMFDPAEPGAIVQAIVDGAEIHDSRTGCATYDAGLFACRGPYGNGVVLGSAVDGRVVNSLFYGLEFGNIRSAAAKRTVIDGNVFRGTRFDSSVYLEFNWQRAIISDNQFFADGQHRSALTLANCDNDGGYMAVVSGNMVTGYGAGGWWAFGGTGCDVIWADNHIDGDDPATATVETCYIGIALDTRNQKATGNVIRNCQIGIGIERGSTTRAWVELNSFSNVAIPITGYTWNTGNLSNRTAHAPVIGTHVIQNNRDAATLAIVNPQ